MFDARPDGFWRDYTGRFQQRPFYKEQTLEALARSFLIHALSSEHVWPISDEDLEFVADMHARLDRGRDVEGLGPEVDAVTIFSKDRLPRIVLSKALSSSNMRRRRRMTIAHELGHVVLHQPMYRGNERQLDLLQEFRETAAYCHDPMERSTVDWCEWQANYFAGALLAPAAELRRRAESLVGHAVVVEDGSREATRLIEAVAVAMNISVQAARVRLAQVSLLKAAGDNQLLPEQTA